MEGEVARETMEKGCGAVTWQPVWVAGSAEEQSGSKGFSVR